MIKISEKYNVGVVSKTHTKKVDKDDKIVHSEKTTLIYKSDNGFSVKIIAEGSISVIPKFFSELENRDKVQVNFSNVQKKITAYIPGKSPESEEDEIRTKCPRCEEVVLVPRDKIENEDWIMDKCGCLEREEESE